MTSSRLANEFRLLAGSAFEDLCLRDKPGLVAVSGGADSMALLACLAEFGVACEVATIDHGLRRDAASEATLVVGVGKRMGFRVWRRRLNLGHVNAGIEARARAARYRALQDIRAARRLNWIATGHTASDQAETLLMRLARGSALRGAGGILERRADGVVRPLLAATRAHALAYVTYMGLPYAIDAMNFDQNFTRVRVRTEVLPRLRRATNPNAELALARFARMAAADDALLTQMARARLESARKGEGVSLDAFLELPKPLAQRALAHYLEAHGLELTSGVVDAAFDAVRNRRSQSLPRDCVLTIRAGVVRVEASPPRRKKSTGGKHTSQK